MTREEAIKHIEMLFPADSEYSHSREIGKRLLKQAKEELEGWRSESTPVLVRYAQLCIEMENL
ncbi:hypothetical protein [Desulforhopalus singaporensis]|uniref:Uncharacterized protein n=1 Tax=Desulforhopalus singaporensis TaxID=91360 RepID=A0A1H0VXE3_9BACT|nr:hypothetical protein [Desulforhopalus singaporensis]SDP70402.1 hypothetical protein SAMN05660330_03761 [Desulforhopalus singaporensis]SDP82796.1 hypothetical protein SAMN05660330_04285 [Desulforhopalus singaporensis]